MADRALGLIEVKGYLGAVVAADAALKLPMYHCLILKRSKLV